MKALEYKKFAIGGVSSSEIKMLHFKRCLNRVGGFFQSLLSSALDLLYKTNFKS